ncbi:hypothetical protein KKE06_03265 [Candidatus Micrarchaeota archaeon]|nr:hypothetical protein [Candidatus Micrarchaeota archaeon]MBU1930632.1 hypothetical protein [Candidatus Micrarchaeota archaeon]
MAAPKKVSACVGKTPKFVIVDSPTRTIPKEMPVVRASPLTGKQYLQAVDRQLQRMAPGKSVEAVQARERARKYLHRLIESFFLKHGFYPRIGDIIGTSKKKREN